LAISVENFVQSALLQPESIEGSHMGTTDFRVKNKIFATLKINSQNGQPQAVLNLDPDTRRLLMEGNLDKLSPVPGGWGEKGWTRIHMDKCDETQLHHWMRLAWEKTAPKTLIRKYPIS
jgi:hypothetical protein